MTFDLQPNLRGKLLRLRRLQADDYPALFTVASDRLIWEQHPASDRYQESVFRKLFDESLASGGALVAIENESDTVIGSSRFHGYDEHASDVEIGWTFLARRFWGGVYNGEMKRLMLQHAFRFVDSVVLLIGPTNYRSQRAAEKIGGIREGVRRDATGLESYVFRITASDFRSR
ncbi:MAG: GNAT family N-acetyltransferase [Pirellulaceae bacterium]